MLRNVRIDEEPHEARAHIAARLGRKAVVWSTPGFPFIFYLLIGAMLAIILGVRPLEAVLGG